MIELKQAVILAGGRGERLKPLTNLIPKPMAPVKETPFLDYLINSILQVGITRILILTGYKGEVIINRYKNLCMDGVDITYSLGKPEDRTARRILNAHAMLDDFFLLLYGDNYWPIELDRMLNLYNKKRVSASMTVFSNRNGTGEYGYENNIEVGEDNFVRQFDKQKKAPNLNGVDIGYFIVDKNTVNPDVEGNISFEKDILPKLISKKELIAYITDKQYHYLTDQGSLMNFESVVARENIRPIPKAYFKGGKNI